MGRVNPKYKTVRMLNEDQPDAPTRLTVQQSVDPAQKDPETLFESIETEEVEDLDFVHSKQRAGEEQSQQAAKIIRREALTSPERLREDGQILQRRIEASETACVILQKHRSGNKKTCLAEKDCL